jgi:hypothetical protein
MLQFVDAVSCWNFPFRGQVATASKAAADSNFQVEVQFLWRVISLLFL